MTSPASTRRASYGPTSPTIGERGARTRRQLMDAALACFIQRGFHDTSVEDIADRAGTSRAALYQYFESKDAIFSELMYESGETLRRVTRQMGELGPTRTGYHNLAVWVRDWVANFDRHAPMYIEWQNVVTPGSPLRPEVIRFSEAFWNKLRKQLAAAQHPDRPQVVSAMLVTSLLRRFNYIRHVFRPDLTDQQAFAGLTVALQLFLFPSTPGRVLATEPIDRSEPGPSVDPPPARSAGPLATLPRHDSDTTPDPFDGLSRQASATASELLDAAARVFNAHGYLASNIDQVVTEAGLARGTFYRYFSSKFDLLVPLAIDASSRMCGLFGEFRDVADSPQSLRDWLRRMLEVQHTYHGVMCAWSETFPMEPELLATGGAVVQAMSDAIVDVFGDRRPHPLSHTAAVMLLSGVVEHFPNEAIGARREPTPDQIVTAQANFIERVILPSHRQR